MSALDHVHQLWRHSAWADAEVLRALRAASSVPPDALREYAHLLGAQETWLSRIEQRASRTAIWPELTLDDAATLAATMSDAYDQLFARLTDPQLEQSIAYTNSAGQPFVTPVVDMLMQGALHGQYHRGKVNLLLRQAGHEPAPVDYITFVRRR